MIILTSFKESLKILKNSGIRSRNPNIYSVARNQPSGFSYPVLTFFAAVDVHGQKIKLRGVEDPINSYRDTLFEYYDSVEEEIFEWVDNLKPGDVDILCCWCPHSESTKNQVKTRGEFVCHTGLIGQIINKYRNDIDVYMDNDRASRLIQDFRPKYRSLVV
jgi:hypothetical protein